ncbi:MAG: type III-A CRISPR-associated protein Csm2 [Thermovirgaceae bacterium]|nr:type III-A CRISPR-associated protein Csm2 [Thermovirga sp.]
MSQPTPAQAAGTSIQGYIQRIKSLPSLQELTAEKLVEMTRSLGKRFAEKKVPASQIYKFHEHIIRLATNVSAGRVEPSEAKILSYHLSYAAARITNVDQRNAMKELASFFDAALEKTGTAGDIVRLRQISEAVVAYHKFFGGRN